MAIGGTIVLTSPDGATEKVRILDDSIRTLKQDIQERMDDAGQGLIAGSWLDTTTKELKEGIGRLFTDTRANQAGLTRLVDGKVFIATDPLVTGVASQYYNGAAWADVPVASANLMTDSVIAAKIATDAVTTVKLQTGASDSANRAVSIWQTEKTVSADTTTATTSWSTPAGIAALTFALTPVSANSIMGFYLHGHHGVGGAGGFGGVRIRKTTAGATTVKTLAAAACMTFAGTGSAYVPQPFYLFGWFTGETAAITVDVQIVESVGATTYHLDGTVALDGDTFPIRYGAVEVKR